MKRILNTLAAIFILALSQSCSLTDKKEEIAILIPSDIDRFRNVAKTYAAKVEELGYHCTIYNAKNNETQQLEQAREAIGRGVKSVCISPVNGNSAAAIVRELKNAGIPVIAYNRLVYNCNLDCFVAGDIKGLAKMMVETAVKEKPNGNYYIIGGDRFDLNGEMLRKNIDSLLAPYEKSGDINVVYRNYIENWDPIIATRELTQAVNLSGKKPDAIISAYDGISAGIIGEIERLYGTTEGIVITGQDAEIEAIKNILAGKQTMTALHSVKSEAISAAMVAVALAKGQKIDGISGQTFNGQTDVPTIHVSSVKITKDNIDDVIIKGGTFTAAQVYGE